VVSGPCGLYTYASGRAQGYVQCCRGQGRRPKLRINNLQVYTQWKTISSIHSNVVSCIVATHILKSAAAPEPGRLYSHHPPLHNEAKSRGRPPAIWKSTADNTFIVQVSIGVVDHNEPEAKPTTPRHFYATLYTPRHVLRGTASLQTPPRQNVLNPPCYPTRREAIMVLKGSAN